MSIAQFWTAAVRITTGALEDRRIGSLVRCFCHLQYVRCLSDVLVSSVCPNPTYLHCVWPDLLNFPIWFSSTAFTKSQSTKSKADRPILDIQFPAQWAETVRTCTGLSSLHAYWGTIDLTQCSSGWRQEADLQKPPSPAPKQTCEMDFRFLQNLKFI